MTTKALQLDFAECHRTLTFAEFDALPDADMLDSAEWKEDGRRYHLQIRPNGAKQNYVVGKRTSKVTGLLCEAQGQLISFRDRKFDLPPETVLDCEFVHPDGGTSNEAATAVAEDFAVCKVFDVLMHGGDDLRNHPLDERRGLLKLLARSFAWERLKLMPTSYNPRALMRSVRAADGEGLILKDSSAEYGKGWWKVKDAQVHDCVVVGYVMSTEGKYHDNGWIKSVRIGQWVYYDAKNSKAAPTNFLRLVKGKGQTMPRMLLDVGCVSGFTEDKRAWITANRKKLMGAVIAVKAQQRFPSLAFRSPRVAEQGFRDDKNPAACFADNKVRSFR